MDARTPLPGPGRTTIAAGGRPGSPGSRFRPPHAPWTPALLPVALLLPPLPGLANAAGAQTRLRPPGALGEFLPLALLLLGAFLVLGVRRARSAPAPLGACAEAPGTAARPAEGDALRRNAAESLAGLGHRQQNLALRQLALVGKLEREGALDAAALADLHALGRLAHRARRDAKSLLLLAGECGPRPRSVPLPLPEVLRSALADAGEAPRVALRRLDPAPVDGAAAAELSHLFAELIENALGHTPEDLGRRRGAGAGARAGVEVEGLRTSAGYLVSILDHGPGMDARALDAANARLSGSTRFLAEPAHGLGHLVIGALARKHGIVVRLGVAPGAGLVARVLLPAELLDVGAGAAGGPRGRTPERRPALTPPAVAP